MRVLVLNCYSRNALAVINAVDPDIELVGGAAHSRQKYFLTERFFKSRRLTKIVRYASPQSSSEDFKEDLILIAKRDGIDLILPTGTDTTNELSRHKKEIEKSGTVVVAVEDFDKLDILCDKWLTYLKALEAGVPAPRTQLLSSPLTLSFPVVIKPRRSFASHGVQFFSRDSDLQDFLSKGDITRSDYVVQEVVEGTLHDVTGCAQNGRCLSLLSQQRHVSLYDFGGGGIINLTTDDAKLRELGRKLISAMSWNGPFDVEFMQDRNGNHFLLECNPKIWGTTHLTVQAGLNVPQQMIDVFTRKGDLPVASQYEVGLLCRWYFPEILYHLTTKPRQLKRIYRRVLNTFRNFGGKRSVTNLNLRDLPHLFGIIFDRAEI